MGNRSKSQEPGAFGSKKFLEDGTAIIRPNRGRNRWKHGKIKQKGRRPITVGKIVSDSAKKAK